MSAQVYSLLGQTEGERKPFLGGCKKWGHIVRLTPRDFVAIRDEKVPPFVKFGITPPLFFIRPPYKELEGYGYYDKFMDRFQDISKVKNHAVSKAEV